MKPSVSFRDSVDAESIASQLSLANNMKTMLVRQSSSARESLRHLGNGLCQQMDAYRRTLAANSEEESHLRNRLNELRNEVCMREKYVAPREFEPAMDESVCLKTVEYRAGELQQPLDHQTVNVIHQPGVASWDEDFETELLALVSMRDRLLGHIEDYNSSTHSPRYTS